MVLKPLRAALELQPGRPDLRVALARSLRQLGQLEAAMAEYQWLLDDGNPPPTLVIESAECLAQVGRGLEARSLLDREALSDRADARFLLARLDLSGGQSDTARSELETLVDSADQVVAEKARLLLSQLALREGDHHSALAALGLDAGQDQVSSERLWKAAEIANQAGLADQEQRWLSALLERVDTPPALRQRTRPRLADLCDKAGDYDRAAQLLHGAGWRAPIGLADDAEAIVQMALDAPDHGRALDAIEDDRQAPVVILGWPGCGREAVLHLGACSDYIGCCRRRSGRVVA